MAVEAGRVGIVPPPQVGPEWRVREERGPAVGLPHPLGLIPSEQRPHHGATGLESGGIGVVTDPHRVPEAVLGEVARRSSPLKMTVYVC